MRGTDWDESLPSWLRIRWIKWFEQLTEIVKVDYLDG